MYLLYLHTVHTSYMYFFAACVVPVFIAYMLPARSFKKKKKTAPRSSTTPYVQCTTSVVSYCHAGGEEGLLWRSNMVPTSYLAPRRYVACKVANNNRNVTRRQTVENAYRYVKVKVR